MFRVGMLILTTLFLCSALACAYLAVHQADELVHIRAQRKNVGELKQRQTIKTVFNVVNEYPFPIQIFKVWNSCACAGVHVPNRKLNPGDKSVITIVWKTGLSRGKIAVEASLYYRLPEGQLRSLDLRVEGRVIPDIWYTPDELSFQARLRQVQTIKFTAGRLNKFLLKQAYCTHRAFSARIDNAKSVVEVAYDPDKCSSQSIRGVVLSVDTNSQIEKTLQIPIRFVVDTQTGKN